MNTQWLLCCLLIVNYLLASLSLLCTDSCYCYFGNKSVFNSTILCVPCPVSVMWRMQDILFSFCDINFSCIKSSSTIALMCKYGNSRFLWCKDWCRCTGGVLKLSRRLVVWLIAYQLYSMQCSVMLQRPQLFLRFLCESVLCRLLSCIDI